MKHEIHCTSHNLPISKCMECWPVFCAETGITIERRAFEWLLGDDTGISSETLCAHMLGVEKTGPFGKQAPSDAADRGRCIRLLQRIPEWVPRLDELLALDTGTISVNGAPAIPRSEHYQSWAQQLPLIRKEGKL